MSNEFILEARDLRKCYFRGTEVPVLQGVDLDLTAGELATIVGESGSGKSTLLHLLGLLDFVDAGEIHWRGRRIDNLSRREKDRLRNQTIGFVFQFYHLLPELSTLENIMLPAMVGGSILQYAWKRKQIRAEAENWLNQVGLAHRAKHKPKELSGGEMQRTAIARALMAKPELLLADEPTGNLDKQTGQGVVDLLFRLCREQQLTVLLVTHDEKIAQQGDRILRLEGGRILPNPSLTHCGAA